jgi:glutamate-ammonia-ligase adenylyltransferase
MGDIPLEGHNMKLGAGGIREIEFFTQTRQLIAGGRDPDLRDRTTAGGLAALAAKGWLPGDVAAGLTAHYREHREIEHRLQMVNDAQTHLMPGSPEGIDRIARFMGEGDTARFRARLQGRLAEVAALTEGFFSPGQQEATAPECLPLSETAEAIVARWDSYPALRSDRARTVFKRLRPEILARMQRAGEPDEALAQFDGFLAGLPAGVQLFALFEANPQLIDLIVDICATAPRLARYLARNAGVLDAVLAGAFFAPWPGEARLAAELGARLEEVGDYERKLDAARVWAKEWHFRIGVHHLRGVTDAFEAAAQYADLARACVAGMWGPVCAEFARRHGPPPGRGAVVLGMGSLGAGRLNAVSDLDLILIYDAEGQDGSDGPRPLTTTAYFARLTKALITALSAPMAEGRLYEVDMRLRPSGRQGPVATALSSFDGYQRHEAWTWEHLALTRARVVAGAGAPAGGHRAGLGGEGAPDAAARAGSAALAAEVEALRREILAEKGRGAQVIPDAAEMRARTAAARPGAGRWDMKAGPGRLQEIELVAQVAGLRAGSAQRGVEAQLAAGVRAGWPARADADALLAAYRLCWRVHCAGRLLADGVLDPGALGAGACAFVLREAEADDLGALAARIDDCTAAAADVVARLLGAEAG